MMRTAFCSFLLTALSCFHCFAQEDFSWWNRIHDWDGVTPWNRYMTLSAGYLGPNALPVPEVRDGRVDTLFRFDLLAGGHFSPGDRTVDGYVRLAAPFSDGKVSFEIAAVPIEYYVTDTATRDERASRERDGRGLAAGDIHLTTLIQLIRDHPSIPDILLETSFRIPSGKTLLGARYTDAPGYHMDLSFGRLLSPQCRFKVRAYALAGYYAYQTFDPQHLQDDCFLYGIGVRIATPGWAWSNQLTGYSGYMDNGDRPRLYRSELRRIGAAFDGLLQIQVGLHDFEYRSVHAGLSWKISHAEPVQRMIRKAQR